MVCCKHSAILKYFDIINNLGELNFRLLPQNKKIEFNNYIFIYNIVINIIINKVFFINLDFLLKILGVTYKNIILFMFK